MSDVRTRNLGSGAVSGPAPAAAPAVRRPRDIRLDFFRGVGMFIIFVAHMPSNTWTAWIPARFGFSDATEIFVFCSGMASAIAFGRLFRERGLALGTTRIAFRCWQVYWAHISIFMAVAASMVMADRIFDNGQGYQGGLNLLPFINDDTGANLVGLMTLTYVPNYFDILPMYLVILAMIPIVMALARLSTAAVFAFIGGVWLLATMGLINFPAEPWSDRVWFFNPFAWQLVFFTGFAFMMGWLPAPPIDRRLIWLSAAVIVIVIPFAHWWPLTQWEALREVRAAIAPLIEKTGFGFLRYVHFLALAYLAYALAGPRGDNLRKIRGAFVPICCKVGQQALGVFLAGQLLAMIAGVALNEFGANALTIAAANLIGFALLVAVAYTAAYFKSSPWKQASATPLQPSTTDRSAPAAPASRYGVQGG